MLSAFYGRRTKTDFKDRGGTLPCLLLFAANFEQKSEPFMPQNCIFGHEMHLYVVFIAYYSERTLKKHSFGAKTAKKVSGQGAWGCVVVPGLLGKKRNFSENSKWRAPL